MKVIEVIGKDPFRPIDALKLLGRVLKMKIMCLILKE